MEPPRAFLRHSLATVAYRAAKAVRSAPANFADFDAGEGARTPVQIVAHMGDLFDWALTMAKGPQAWNNATPLAWEDECKRFFSTVVAFDDYIKSDAPMAVTAEKMFQGPVADSLTHIGQLMMLRRLASAAIPSENFARADIKVGQVTMEQPIPAPRKG